MTNLRRTEADIHTVIIGAGPSGLAAAYALIKKGILPVVVDKDRAVGGLMRSIQRGSFIVDIGRKELYTRLTKVDALWNEILGDDYINYHHREGILYNSTIIETNPNWKGPLRGMPWSMVWISGIDYIWSRFKNLFEKPHNYEQYWYGKRGKKLSQILSQGYEEKFKGVKWRDLPVPEERSNASISAREIADPLLSQHRKNQTEPLWRHPAMGSGQICSILQDIIQATGASLRLGANILGITTSNNYINTITVDVGSEVITYRPQHLISSIPAEIMARYLKYEDSSKNDIGKRQDESPGYTTSTVCVYLFLNEPPRFPHVWLKITSPDSKAGRITNYSAFGGRMVPDGMTCLCVEYFRPKSDSLFTLTDDKLIECAVAECDNANIISPDKCFDGFVLKLPDANAATSWRDWNTPRKLQLLSFFAGFDNLYYINRPGTDKATYAGLEAASAIVANDRRIFFEEMTMSLPCWDISLLRSR